ncbi:transposase [Psychromonas antarctica]|uniref:transposase n=1 Tax=Psychromonas antarctica TaxID=67573 RepID=UPI001EE7AE42|nr:transposase [Psychromonas antarctica]MCG6202274.1 transposase [Psychromonas antarctica]
MTSSIRKNRIKFTSAQKLEYAKLMVEENYSNNQIIELSGASSSAVVRWKKQYLAEKSGETSPNLVALDPQIRRIKELEKQLLEAQKDNEILKKATAFFIRDNPALR